MTSFGDHGMEGELRELAERYAAEMSEALREVRSAFAGQPVEDVRSQLTARLSSAGVPFDADEVAAYAQEISDSPGE